MNRREWLLSAAMLPPVSPTKTANSALTFLIDTNKVWAKVSLQGGFVKFDQKECRRQAALYYKDPSMESAFAVLCAGLLDALAEAIPEAADKLRNFNKE